MTNSIEGEARPVSFTFRAREPRAWKRRPLLVTLSIVGATLITVGISSLVESVPLKLAIVILAAVIPLLLLRKRCNYGGASLLAAPGFAVLVVALDLNSIVGSILTYALASVVALYVLSEPRTAKSQVHAKDYVLIGLLMWGVPASLLGRLVLDQQENSLAFFIPLTVALLHLVSPLDATARTRIGINTRDLLYAGSAGYIVMAALSAAGALPLFSSEHFHHTRLSWAAMAISACVLHRQWVLLAGATAATLFSFLSYPALTYLVVCVAGIAIFALCRLRQSRMVIIGGALLAALLVGQAFLPVSLDSARQSYFDSVGKGDNTRTREILFQLGVDRFQRSPVYGDLFTENIASSVPRGLTRDVTRIPLHNDYLQFAVGGGILGASLLVLWFFLTIADGIGRARTLQLGTAEHRVTVVALVGFASVAVTAAFNPVLVDAGQAIQLAVLYLILNGTARAPASCLQQPSIAHDT